MPLDARQRDKLTGPFGEAFRPDGGIAAAGTRAIASKCPSP